MGLAGKSPLEENAQGHTPWGQGQGAHPWHPFPQHPQTLVAPQGGFAGRRDRDAPLPRGLDCLRCTWLWENPHFLRHLEHLPARLQQTSPLNQSIAQQDGHRGHNSHPWAQGSAVPASDSSGQTGMRSGVGEDKTQPLIPLWIKHPRGAVVWGFGAGKQQLSPPGAATAPLEYLRGALRDKRVFFLSPHLSPPLSSPCLQT